MLLCFTEEIISQIKRHSKYFAISIACEHRTYAHPFYKTVPTYYKSNYNYLEYVLSCLHLYVKFSKLRGKGEKIKVPLHLIN
jgi:hypothetical protein